MKKSFALSILVLCSMASAQGKYRLGQPPVDQDPADYPIKLHISATHFRPYCTGSLHEVSCTDGLYVDASLNGKKVELFGGIDKRQSSQIVLGEYLAMLPKKPRYGGQAVVGQRYYVLLPDRSAWICGITGLSE